MGRKIVCCAGGNDSQRDVQPAPHQRVEYNVYGTVTAGGNDNVIISGHLCNMFFDITGGEGTEGMNLIAALLKNSDADV